MVPYCTRNRVLTLLMALALLVTHELGASHSHCHGRHQGPPGCRGPASHHPPDGFAHLEEGGTGTGTGFCLLCALLGDPPGCATPASPPDPNRFLESRPALRDLPPAHLLYLGQPGRSPPTS